MSEDTGVTFRCEKTYLDFQAEVDAAAARGEDLDSAEMDRWKILGDTIMGQLPSKGAFMFINGISYRILDVTWSIKLAALPGQPTFDPHEAMITVRQETSTVSEIPSKDFFAS